MSREDFRRVVHDDPVDLARACLLIGREVEPDVDIAAGLAGLDRLAAGVACPAAADPAGAAAALRRGLSGFEGAAEDYADLRSSLLHEVLRRRRGLPILLAVVWLEVAKRARVPAFPVGLPGHFLVGVGSPDGPHVLVDAFTGGTVVERPPAGVRAYHNLEVLLRVLNNVRAQAADLPALVESNQTALWATELSLLLPRHPAILRRDYGVLLARVGQFAQGATELEAYAEAVSAGDPGAAEEARREARLSRARLN